MHRSAVRCAFVLVVINTFILLIVTSLVITCFIVSRIVISFIIIVSGNFQRLHSHTLLIIIASIIIVVVSVRLFLIAVVIVFPFQHQFRCTLFVCVVTTEQSVITSDGANVVSADIIFSNVRFRTERTLIEHYTAIDYC